ncbi:unnamed protein product, partial [Mesorhabditis belari]|uniref:C-type lectin domain-containing protein n=1 Tax=Mesorhabditis belari TaxID=2138241 RepID=A0AAF3EKT0_9BILA
MNRLLKMKSISTICLFVVLPIVSTQSNTTAAPDCQGCQAYQCLDDSIAHCGPTGYPIAFGLFYCKRFDQYYDEFNSAGKAFADCVKPALLDFVQSYLNNVNGPVNCNDLENKALDSHVPIFLGCNFCNVWLSNLPTFTKILYTALNQDRCWLGAQRSSADKPWSWSDGTTMDYQRFGTPDEKGNCAFLDSRDLLWKEGDCTSKFFFFCSTQPLSPITTQKPLICQPSELQPLYNCRQGLCCKAGCHQSSHDGHFYALYLTGGHRLEDNGELIWTDGTTNDFQMKQCSNDTRLNSTIMIVAFSCNPGNDCGFPGIWWIYRLIPTDIIPYFVCKKK